MNAMNRKVKNMTPTAFDRWAEAMDKKVDKLFEKVDLLNEQALKKVDMEQFRHDVCSPSREKQELLERKINNLTYFKAKVLGIVLACQVFFAVALFLIEMKVFKGTP